MPTPKTFITTDRQCDQCEYNLKGLPTEGKCPECGTQIRRRTKRTSGTMSQEAPTRFVKKLQRGFNLATLGIFGSIVLIWFGIGILPSLLWVGGIWIITSERPNRDQIVPDATLDDDRFRNAVRYTSLAWPIYSLVVLALIVLNNSPTKPSPFLQIPLQGLSIIFGSIAWIGLIPACIYFAELGYWASHDHLAQRLRGTAWTMAVVGSILVLLTAIGSMSNSLGGAASFASFFAYIILTIAVIVFLFTVAQLGSVMKWVIKHQKMAVGSANRVRERIERDIETPGVINTGLVCRSCKYDLDGLPYGGRCPECGESYAEFTPLPILDPATMYTRAQRAQSEVEIEIEAGDNKGIYFNQELDAFGKPKAAGVPFTPEDNPIPDEGDIPLFDNSDDSPENEQTSNGL